MTLPPRTPALAPASGQLPVDPRSSLSPDRRQRDFLLLTIFVLAQQGYVDRAGVLAEALYLVGDDSEAATLARAVLRFIAGDWPAAITCLEELDRIAPIERFGSYTLDDRQRMRRYLKARCLHETGDTTRAREAVEVYLR